MGLVEDLRPEERNAEVKEDEEIDYER